jgi:hypothetical protein
VFTEENGINIKEKGFFPYLIFCLGLHIEREFPQLAT